MHSAACSVLCFFSLMFVLPARAQSDDDAHSNTGTFVGTVRHAPQRAPLADVVVTARSPSLQGELMISTDAQGNYRIPQLPPGDYTLTFEKEGFKAHARSGVRLRLKRTRQVDVELLTAPPEEPVRVIGDPPSIERGSTRTEVNVDRAFIKRIAVARSYSCDRTGASHSFDHCSPECPAPCVSLNGPRFSVLPSLPMGYSRPFPVPPPTR